LCVGTIVFGEADPSESPEIGGTRSSNVLLGRPRRFQYHAARSEYPEIQNFEVEHENEDGEEDEDEHEILRD